METNTLYKRFQDYQEKKMSSAELASFKLELQTNKETKRAFIAFLLNNLKSTDTTNLNDWEMISEAYLEISAVKMVNPSKVYVVKRFAMENWSTIAVAASLLILIVYSFAIYNSSANQLSRNFAQIMFEPESNQRASASGIQNSEKSFYFYSQPTPSIDSLEALAKACTSFCIPQYYLAHAYLKTGQFEKANLLFEQCLKHLDYLDAIPELQGSASETKFNALLTQVLMKNDAAVILPKLDSLIGQLKHDDAVYLKAMKLRKILD